MSSPVFTLQVPTDPTYRSMACEVMGRYVEIVGGSEAERVAFQAELAGAIETLTPDPNADLECVCDAAASGFEITLTCQGRTAVVRHTLGTV